MLDFHIKDNDRDPNVPWYFISEKVFQHEFKLQYPILNNWVFWYQNLDFSRMAVGYLTVASSNWDAAQVHNHTGQENSAQGKLAYFISFYMDTRYSDIWILAQIRNIRTSSSCFLLTMEHFTNPLGIFAWSCVHSLYRVPILAYVALKWTFFPLLFFLMWLLENGITPT